MQKSLIKKLLLSLASVALLFAFTACSSDSEEQETQQQPEIVNYTVSFNSDGGGDVASQTVESGKLATEPTTKPSKTGYTFSAWYDGETAFDFSKPITKNTTLTAKWTANTYTVTLDNNGETTEVTATYGEKLPNLEEVPTLANSDFGGFYTEKYAKGTKYIGADGIGCKVWESTEDATLYAAWGYRINYVNPKEDVENQNPEIYTGEEDVTLADLEHILGYAFIGWYDAETDGNKVESIAVGNTGTKTLYARWQEVSYTVKHLFQNLEDDEYTEDTSLQETVPGLLGAIAEATATTRTGFSWKSTEEKTVELSNTVVNVYYDRIIYAVTFDTKSGSSVETQKVKYGAKATAPTTSRNPFDFVGWYTSNNEGETLAETAFDFNTPITAPLTLYAKWYLDLSNCTADNVLAKINAMTKSGTVVVKGAISNSTISDIATAIKAKEFGNGLDLSGTTGLTEIANSAFSDCKKLANISIPASVTSIGDSAFYGCSALTSISIPAGVTSIGEKAFSGCSALTSVSISASVTSIGEEAFSYCSRLKNVNYLGTLEQWCNINFSNPTSNPMTYSKKFCINGEEITELVIPDGVTTIKNYAFDGCSSLTSVTIPNSVTSIGEEAFSGCSGLTSVTIPDSVRHINFFAFYDCSGLKNVNYLGTLEQWCNIDFNGSHSNPTTYNGKLCINGVEITELEIPAGVTTIKNYAFYGCSSLTSVTIPDSVRCIDEEAFYGCSSLTSITIPNNVYAINSYAFSGCSKLTEITFKGTGEQWKAISKGIGWHNSVPSTTKVTCSDGEAELD